MAASVAGQTAAVACVAVACVAVAGPTVPVAVAVFLAVGREEAVGAARAPRVAAAGVVVVRWGKSEEVKRGA